MNSNGHTITMILNESYKTIKLLLRKSCSLGNEEEILTIAVKISNKSISKNLRNIKRLYGYVLNNMHTIAVDSIKFHLVLKMIKDTT